MYTYVNILESISYICGVIHDEFLLTDEMMNDSNNINKGSLPGIERETVLAKEGYYRLPLQDGRVVETGNLSFDERDDSHGRAGWLRS